MNKNVETFLWLLGENALAFSAVYFSESSLAYAPLLSALFALFGKELNKKIKQNNESK